jgi:putative oxidoreductase
MHGLNQACVTSLPQNVNENRLFTTHVVESTKDFFGEVTYDIGLLLLRLAVGLTLAAHGTQKLFGWFGGRGLSATGQFFTVLGFPPGRRHALMAALGEMIGGVLLAVGLATPAAVAVVVSVMLVAAVTAHNGKGFFAQNGGYEYVFVLAVVALTLACTGPGSFSIDALVGFSRSGISWGIAALLAGLVGGGTALLERRKTPAQQAVIDLVRGK